jgi:hypothetical protein
LGVESFSTRININSEALAKPSVYYYTAKICTARATIPLAWKSNKLIFQLLTLAMPTV